MAGWSTLCLATCSRPDSPERLAAAPELTDASVVRPLTTPDAGTILAGNPSVGAALDAAVSVAPPAPEQGSVDCTAGEGALPALKLTPITTGIAQPTYAVAPPGDAERLFVLERAGTVRILRQGQLSPEPFLDLSARVATSGDQGLLGLAFHPEFAANGRFYVMYALTDAEAQASAPGVIVVSEFVRSATDPARAAPAERRLIEIQPPSAFHAGGMLAFGPRDRMLYIGVGDGGAHAGQDLASLLGKVLRIDVDAPTPERPYGIPAGNMAGDGVLPEIWSYGLRNPWRFSFDACTGALYIGDVGEGAIEEIDFEPANTPGRDYGWSTLEGSSCFDTDATCDRSGVTLPVFEYPRSFGCAVISGHVYRGQRIPALRGVYLYADYCSGGIGSFRVVEGTVVDFRDLTEDLNPDGVSGISSFAVDAAGELYLLNIGGGLYRVDPE